MKKLLLPLVIVVVLSSCSKEINKQDNEDLRISMNTATVASTKTAINGTKVAFAEGDNIGLFEVQNNGTDAKQWRLTSSKWTTASAMYWRDKTASTHTFYAFHPYDVATDHTVVAMPTLAAQVGDVASLSAKDFLCAKPLVDHTHGSTGVINLQFDHISALIQLNIKAKGDAEGSRFTSFTVTKEGIANTATCNLADASVTINTTDVSTITVTPDAPQTLSTTASTYYVVANQGTGNNIDFAIEFTKNGVPYSAVGVLVVKGDLANGLVAGSKYSFDVTVSLNSVSIGDAGAADWVEVDGNDEVEAK